MQVVALPHCPFHDSPAHRAAHHHGRGRRRNPGEDELDSRKFLPLSSPDTRNDVLQAWPQLAKAARARGYDPGDDAIEVLDRGGNVAVVLTVRPDVPLEGMTWWGYPVLDADETDVRFQDAPGHVAGLRPKGVFDDVVEKGGVFMVPMGHPSLTPMDKRKRGRRLPGRSNPMRKDQCAYPRCNATVVRNESFCAPHLAEYEAAWGRQNPRTLPRLRVPKGALVTTTTTIKHQRQNPACCPMCGGKAKKTRRCYTCSCGCRYTARKVSVRR